MAQLTAFEWAREFDAATKTERERVRVPLRTTTANELRFPTYGGAPSWPGPILYEDVQEITTGNAKIRKAVSKFALGWNPRAAARYCRYVLEHEADKGTVYVRSWFKADPQYDHDKKQWVIFVRAMYAIFPEGKDALDSR